MLGRLLHLGSGGSGASQPNNQSQASSSRPVSSLESVHEDIHTRQLLFPDTQTLLQHRDDQVFPLLAAPTTPSAPPGTAFDHSEEAGIESKDIRVVIMQDTLGSMNTALLYDSHPPPPTSSSPTIPQEPRRAPAPRKGSLAGTSSRPTGIQGDAPPHRGAFDRRGSLHGRTTSQAETDAQRALREYRDEIASISGCVFGSSELMAYKGTSTKLHMLPSETRASDLTGPIFGDGRSSIGRARSSRLSQSFSSQAVSPSTRSPLTSALPVQRYKKILITKLFPVNIPAEDVGLNPTPQSKFSDDINGFPFPQTSEESTTRKKKVQPRQRKTPMYAIVLVVQLPMSRGPAGPGRSNLRDSSSFTETDMFPSSYSSTRPSAWGMSNSGLFGDPADAMISIDLDDRMDQLAQHWDVIKRALTHLQSISAITLATLLKQQDISSPDPSNVGSVASHMGQSLTERRGPELRVKTPKDQKGTSKTVSLSPNSLADNDVIATQVAAAKDRIVTGLSASRVVTGQGRWGIWRDEAIWATKWAANAEKERFFSNLLTGFLATHTDWLQALCPTSYRRRYFLTHQDRNEDDILLPSRTVIVSEDKMAARRFVFLLSAFLPANQDIPTARAHRPSTSTSLGTYSNSPPKYVIPVLREESLRRKLNRRTAPHRASHSRTASQSMAAAAVPAQLAHLSMNRAHSRRPSDAMSIRTANMAMPNHEMVSRKSSAATTTTIMPEAAMPHFSSVRHTDSRRRHRPGSSSSIAADDLKRTLTRGDSSGQASTGSNDAQSQGSRWGSVISTLWSARRRESSSLSAYSQNNDPKSPATTRTSFARERYSEASENAIQEDEVPEATTPPRRGSIAQVVTTPREQNGRVPFPTLDRSPEPSSIFSSPVKATVNEEDGVIDVDVPFPDYTTSFESAISSPSSSGYLSTPGNSIGLDAFERAANDGDVPLNAAGWLRQYHPDFALQAIPPQEDLIESIKASLRAEPTPTPPPNSMFDAGERWVDIGTALIADATTNTISRILYRRLVKPPVPLDRASAGSLPSAPVLTPSVLPYETQLEEEWIEEAVFRPDENLEEALNKVMDLQQDSSKISSSTSSAHAHAGSLPGQDAQLDGVRTPLETPRAQCKTVMLSALEDTIRDVIESGDKTQGQPSGSHQSILRAAIRAWVSNLEAFE